jgi:hypothetical protein
MHHNDIGNPWVIVSADIWAAYTRAQELYGDVSFQVHISITSLANGKFTQNLTLRTSISRPTRRHRLRYTSSPLQNHPPFSNANDMNTSESQPSIAHGTSHPYQKKIISHSLNAATMNTISAWSPPLTIVIIHPHQAMISLSLQRRNYESRLHLQCRSRLVLQLSERESQAHCTKGYGADRRDPMQSVEVEEKEKRNCVCDG